jgi:hypothetical protein
LPAFVIVDTAKENDALRARELCANVQSGEIVVFDRAYVDFQHLFDLMLREIHWVTRSKENLVFKVVKRRTTNDPRILADQEVQIMDQKRRASHYPERIRRIRALVEVDGKEREMEFLTNNMEWSPRSIADLYRSRWQIEVFFKQIKQTLKLSDFLGNSANAVRWQIWTALLMYLLLRYLSVVTSWDHSFSRLFTLLRTLIWNKLHLVELLKRYGTADGGFRAVTSPQGAFSFYQPANAMG